MRVADGGQSPGGAFREHVVHAIEDIAKTLQGTHGLSCIDTVFSLSWCGERRHERRVKTCEIERPVLPLIDSFDEPIFATCRTATGRKRPFAPSAQRSFNSGRAAVQQSESFKVTNSLHC